MSSIWTVLGIGESLFDLLPEGRFIGGAPLNFAYHANQLLQPLGGSGMIATRVGNDVLGQEIVTFLKQSPMKTDLVQIDPDWPTGTVSVEFKAGEPNYTIHEQVAWDRIQWDATLDSLSNKLHGICFGTLGQRNPESRQTIQKLIQSNPKAIRLLDVNLRQAYFSGDLLRSNLQIATILKLNETELPIVLRLLGMSFDRTQPFIGCQLLQREFQLSAVIYTRGEKGTAWIDSKQILEGSPANYPMQPNADAIGAGDACSAGIMIGSLLGWPATKILDLANHVGAYVASQTGATPQFPESILQLLWK